MGFWRRIYWENILFLALIHFLGVAGIAYAALFGLSWRTACLSGIWFLLCALSISAGYHRLLSHRTYRCSAAVRLFYLVFGAASFQASALRWAGDHRDHHAHTDTDGDPYNITKGFWWAHWGWLCYRGATPDMGRVKDLAEDPLIVFQDRHYLSLAFFAGFLLPTAIAWSWGDAPGGLLLAGGLRLLLQYHASFSINSVAHTFGRRPYSTATSARDSHLASLLTMGEGYHNYHHRFPSDYRNGVRAFHFDPSKWLIWAFSKAGLAWDLKSVPESAVKKAMETVVQEISGGGSPPGIISGSA